MAFNPTFDAYKPELPGMNLSFALVNEMGDDYYDEDLHEYNCVHFAQEMSEYLAQDG